MVEDTRPVEEAHGQDRTHDVYTVANIITVLRLVLVPFFFSVLITDGHDVLSFSLFALAASTDWLDGQIARRTGTVTELGKIIDPLVDRLLIAAGVLGLFLVGRLPGWVVAVLFARDAYLLAGAWVLERAHAPRVPVIYLGKVTTALLLVGFSGAILNMPQVPGLGWVEGSALPGFGTQPTALAMWFIYAGLVTSVATAGMYTVYASRNLRTARSSARPSTERTSA